MKRKLAFTRAITHQTYGTGCRPIQEDALKPFLAAARWIPLAVDPFLSLLDIFMVGMKGRSGLGQREVMQKYVTIILASLSLSTDCGRDDQYKCIVFELIMPLVPKFINVLSDYHCKDPQAFQNFVKEVSLSRYMRISVYQQPMSMIDKQTA